MNPSPQNGPSRLAEPRDDYKEGFIDALFYQQGIEQPTLAQIGQALAVLIGCRAHHDFARQDLVDMRLEQLAAMEQLRQALLHPDAGANAAGADARDR